MQFFSQSILAKISAVAVICSPFILGFGYLYKRTSGLPLSRSLFKAYSVLQDVPGASACDEEDDKSAWVLNLTHMVCPSHLGMLAFMPQPSGKARFHAQATTSGL
jgi:hypothetical protein